MLGQLPFAISVAKPFSLSVKTYGTEQGTLKANAITNVIKVWCAHRPDAILVKSGICEQVLGHFSFAIGFASSLCLSWETYGTEQGRPDKLQGHPRSSFTANATAPPRPRGLTSAVCRKWPRRWP